MHADVARRDQPDEPPCARVLAAVGGAAARMGRSLARVRVVADLVPDCEAAGPEVATLQGEDDGPVELSPELGGDALKRHVRRNEEIGLLASFRLESEQKVCGSASLCVAGIVACVAAPAAARLGCTATHTSWFPRARPAGLLPTRIDSASSVVGSRRVSVPSPPFATHTPPGPTARPVDARPTPRGTVATTPRVRGSSFVTVAVFAFNVHTASCPTATATGNGEAASGSTTIGMRASICPVRG